MKGVDGKRNAENLLKRIHEIEDELFIANNPNVQKDGSNEELLLERQSLRNELQRLQQRREASENSLGNKVVWNIVVPIVVSFTTALFTIASARLQ